LTLKPISSNGRFGGAFHFDEQAKAFLGVGIHGIIEHLLAGGHRRLVTSQAETFNKVIEFMLPGFVAAAVTMTPLRKRGLEVPGVLETDLRSRIRPRSSQTKEDVALLRVDMPALSIQRCRGRSKRSGSPTCTV
jgi:hypothetical protein